MQVCSRPLNCACFRSGWILEPSITTTRSRRLRRTSVALAFFACFLSVTSLAKQTEEEKAAKAAAAQEKLLQVFVSEPYLELSTGPGRGYPVFHVVEREQSVDVLHRRTDWFKVRTERRRRRLGACARHAPHQARRRLALRLQSRRPRGLHHARLGTRHRRWRLRRRESHRALCGALAHRQHEGRASRCRSSSAMRRTAGRPRSACSTCCFPNGAFRRS